MQETEVYKTGTFGLPVSAFSSLEGGAVPPICPVSSSLLSLSSGNHILRSTAQSIITLENLSSGNSLCGVVRSKHYTQGTDVMQKQIGNLLFVSCVSIALLQLRHLNFNPLNCVSFSSVDHLSASVDPFLSQAGMSGLLAISFTMS